MGFLKKMKEALALRKMARSSAKAFFDEYTQRCAAYTKMSSDELRELSDTELFEAALSRTEQTVDSFRDFTEGMKVLSEQARIFFIVNYFDGEINNGGLCQFFANSSRAVAPMVGDCLDAIGANDHKALYDSFVSRHGIDVCDLSSFQSSTIEAFTAQYDRYPFNEFDDRFFELKPLPDYLAPFVRANIEYF